MHVVLIPTVEEYRNAGLDGAIWWQDMDYKAFKESAVAELDKFCQENAKDKQTAVKLLYQPEADITLESALDSLLTS